MPPWKPSGARSKWRWSTRSKRSLLPGSKRAQPCSITSKSFTTANGCTALWAIAARPTSSTPTTEGHAMRERKQSCKNKILAAHHGVGRGCQGGAQQGTGARGEQYLDSPGPPPYNRAANFVWNLKSIQTNLI